jgi:aarF domain-containing kinase
VGGIDDEQFPLFASAITGRDYTVLATPGQVVSQGRSEQERAVMSAALMSGMQGEGEGEGQEEGKPLLPQLVQLLARLPRVVLLILKTNDLTRSLDEGLKTSRPERTWLILARYCARTVWREEWEGWRERGWSGWIGLVRAWWAWVGISVRLDAYEGWLRMRRVMS